MRFIITGNVLDQPLIDLADGPVVRHLIAAVTLGKCLAKCLDLGPFCKDSKPFFRDIRHAVLYSGQPAGYSAYRIGILTYDNGNGSLMRILPLALYLHRTMGPEFPRKPEAFQIIHNASALTHAHPISLIACDIYCSIANELLCGRSSPADIQISASAIGKEKSALEFRNWETEKMHRACGASFY